MDIKNEFPGGPDDTKTADDIGESNNYPRFSITVLKGSCLNKGRTPHYAIILVGARFHADREDARGE